MQQPLFELLAAAGWTMVPLYLASVLAVAAMVRTALQFRREGVDARAVDDQATVLGRVVGAARQAAARGSESVERVGLREATRELDALSGGLALLSFLAQAAPLLGLLGTVLGMVDLFGSLEQGGARVDAGLLASGIWKALLTTAAGLVIAIPSLGAHMWFERRLERLRVAIEDGVGQVLDDADGGSA